MTKSVSFELAKLLKEKGFARETYDYYLPDGIITHRTVDTSIDERDYLYDKTDFVQNWNQRGININGQEVYSAPTIAEVVQWLFETYGIWVYAYRKDIVPYWANNIENKAKYDTLEEAYEKAIEICLVD